MEGTLALRDVHELRVKEDVDVNETEAQMDSWNFQRGSWVRAIKSSIKMIQYTMIKGIT